MLRKIILPIIAFCLIGCSSSQHTVVQTETNPEEGLHPRFRSDHISFDFLGGFKNDKVQLVVEGTGIFEGTLTDDPIDGVSDSVTIKKPGNKIDVDVVVNDQYFSSSFDLANGHYFIITCYDEIVVSQTKEVPWYD